MHQRQMAVIMGVASVLSSTDKDELIKDLLNQIPEGKLEQLLFSTQDFRTEVDNVIVVHIGYPSHLSGYLISQQVIDDVLEMEDADAINECIVNSGISIESIESDVFLDMLTCDVNQFHSQLKLVRS